MQKKLISVVIPVYNEEVFLQVFFDKVKKNCKGNFEFIFVNDGSTDYSVRILQKLAEENENVRIVSLVQNYGKQIAIVAGMKHAKGDAVIVCAVKDGEPFTAVNSLADEHMRGAEIVRGLYASKDKNKFIAFFGKMQKGFKRFLLTATSKIFRIKAYIIDKPDIELYDRKVVDIINALPEKNMFLRRTNTLFGYREKTVIFEKTPISAREKEIFEQNKKDFEYQRKSEGLSEPAKVKRRLYSFSLWISYCCFVLFGFLLIASFALLSLKVSPVGIICTFLLTALCGAMSLLFLARATIIRSLGVMYVLGKGEKLYEIKSLTNF